MRSQSIHSDSIDIAPFIHQAALYPHSNADAIKQICDMAKQLEFSGLCTNLNHLQIARERGTTTYHQMGTCRMGPKTDPTAVVDSNLKVYGLNNLRVIDASIMPTLLSANLNAGAIMIGEKGSDMILKENY